MDLSNLKPSDWLIGGGTIAFLISLFLPWYGFGGFNNSGADYFLTGWLPLLLLIGAFVVAVLPKLADGVTIPDPIGPLPRLQAALALAGAAAVLVLLRLLIASDNFGGRDTDFKLDRKFGLILALLAAIAAAVGAFLKNQEGDDTSSTPGNAPPTPF
jgi:hypothetical protein